MKKMTTLVLALIISAIAFSQTPSARALRVENLTSCTINYRIFGSDECPCNPLVHASTTLAIMPMSATFYPNSMLIPGFPTIIPHGIVNARVFHGTMGCVPNFGTVGQTPCGFPPTYTFTALTPLCTGCENVLAQWVPATTCDGVATLRFTPI